jgi:hypothetical protein
LTVCAAAKASRKKGFLLILIPLEAALTLIFLLGNEKSPDLRGFRAKNNVFTKSRPPAYFPNCRERKNTTPGV